MSRFLRPANILDFMFIAGYICQLLDRAAVMCFNNGLNPAPCFYSHITMGTDYIFTLLLIAESGTSVLQQAIDIIASPTIFIPNRSDDLREFSRYGEKLGIL